MLRKRRELRLCWVVLFFVCWLGGTNLVVAQAPKALVIVTDASDEGVFRRIGNSLVEVQLLLSGDTDRDFSDYEACNDRVKDLCHFRFLFYREHSERTADQLWRQRLTAANPSGETHNLSRLRPGPGIEQGAERAKVAHQALLAKLPEQRERLDANLKKELQRLYLLTARPLQLASSMP